jgi:signal recognition particle receptor subunit alpha
MLDAFEIITTSGVVLWSRSYADIGASLVNDFIHAVFIQDQPTSSSNAPYRSQGKTIKWTTAKDLGLVFVVLSPLLPCSLHANPAGRLPVAPSNLVDRQAA